MKYPNLRGNPLLRRWWFALLLAVVLVSTAVAATPHGHTLVGSAVSDAGSYYQYLSIIFKS